MSINLNLGVNERKVLSTALTLIALFGAIVALEILVRGFMTNYVKVVKVEIVQWSWPDAEQLIEYWTAALVFAFASMAIWPDNYRTRMQKATLCYICKLPVYNHSSIRSRICLTALSGEMNDTEAELGGKRP